MQSPTIERTYEQENAYNAIQACIKRMLEDIGNLQQINGTEEQMNKAYRNIVTRQEWFNLNPSLHPHQYGMEASYRKDGYKTLPQAINTCISTRKYYIPRLEKLAECMESPKTLGQEDLAEEIAKSLAMVLGLDETTIMSAIQNGFIKLRIAFTENGSGEKSYFGSLPFEGNTASEFFPNSLKISLSLAESRGVLEIRDFFVASPNESTKIGTPGMFDSHFDINEPRDLNVIQASTTEELTAYISKALSEGFIMSRAELMHTLNLAETHKFKTDLNYIRRNVMHMIHLVVETSGLKMNNIETIVAKLFATDKIKIEIQNSVAENSKNNAIADRKYKISLKIGALTLDIGEFFMKGPYNEKPYSWSDFKQETELFSPDSAEIMLDQLSTSIAKNDEIKSIVKSLATTINS